MMIRDFLSYLSDMFYACLSFIPDYFFHGLAVGNRLFKQDPDALLDIAMGGSERARIYVSKGYYYGMFGFPKDYEKVRDLVYIHEWYEARPYLHLAEQEKLRRDQEKIWREQQEKIRRLYLD